MPNNPICPRGHSVVRIALLAWSVERSLSEPISLGAMRHAAPDGVYLMSATSFSSVGSKCFVAFKPPFRVVSSGDDVAKRHALRILVADDERDTATTLAIILRDEGHEVQTVLRGDEALEMCRLFRPDVVIADINLPGASGYAIARELRERHRDLAPLIIAISGKWTSPADRLLGEAVGFDHFLLKPCDPNALLPLLEPLRTGTDIRNYKGTP